MKAKLASGEAAKNESNFELYFALKILDKHPDEIRKIESELRTALGDYSPPTSSQRRRLTGRDYIYRMLEVIDDKDDGK